MNIFRKKYNFGVLSPEPKDVRDYQLSSIQLSSVELPKSFSLVDKMTSIQSQNYGTCTANAVDSVKEFLDSKEYGKPVKLSQKFIYYNTKKISGLWGIEGDYLDNALKAVVEYGACLEETYPDKKGSNWKDYVSEEPPEEAYKEAEKYKGKTYWRVGRTLEDFRQAVYQQKAPVSFSMKWYSSYNKPKEGVLPLPSGNSEGHAISCVGWDDKERLIIRNSWGTGWGENGYFYIPFSEFDEHEIWDCWILTDICEDEIINGWMAGKYLKRTGSDFKVEDIVTPIYRLNLRKEHTSKSDKVGTYDPGTIFKIEDDKENGISIGGFEWFKVRKM